MQFLEHGRIPGEAAGIEPLHLLDQFLKIGQRLRLTLEALPQGVKLAHGIFVGPLNLLRGRRNRLCFASGRPSPAGIAAIKLAIDRTVTAGPRAAARPELSAVGPAGVSALRIELALLVSLTRLAVARLAVPVELPHLRLLSGLLSLPLLSGLLPA